MLRDGKYFFNGREFAIFVTACITNASHFSQRQVFREKLPHRAQMAKGDVNRPIIMYGECVAELMRVK